MISGDHIKINWNYNYSTLGLRTHFFPSNYFTKKGFFENCMHVQGFFLHSAKSYSIGPPDQYLLVPNILQSFRDISEREQAEPI